MTIQEAQSSLAVQRPRCTNTSNRKLRLQRAIRQTRLNCEADLDEFAKMPEDLLTKKRSPLSRRVHQNG